MEHPPASLSPEALNNRLWVGAFAAFVCILAATSPMTNAQPTPTTRAVTVHQVNGLVVPESATFFSDNLSIAREVLVARQVGIANNLSLEGNAVVITGGSLSFQSGSGLVLPSGAPASIHTLLIPKAYASAGSTEPIRKLEFDQSVIPLAGNLAALKALNVPLSNGPLLPTGFRQGRVLANTVALGISDGAKGDWYWDPDSVIAESPVVQKSSILAPSDPGRWIKL